MMQRGLVLLVACGLWLMPTGASAAPPAGPTRLRLLTRVGQPVQRLGQQIARPLQQATAAIWRQAQRVGLDRFVPVLGQRALGMGVAADRDLLLFYQRVAYDQSIVRDRLDWVVANELVLGSLGRRHSQHLQKTDPDSREMLGLLTLELREQAQLAQALRDTFQRTIDRQDRAFWMKPPSVKWERLANGSWQANFLNYRPRPAGETRLLALLPNIVERAKTDRRRQGSFMDTIEGFTDWTLDRRRFATRLASGRISTAHLSRSFEDYRWIPAVGAPASGHYAYTPAADQPTLARLGTVLGQIDRVNPELKTLLDRAADQSALADMLRQALDVAKAGGPHHQDLAAAHHRASMEARWADMFREAIQSKAMAHAVQIDDRMIAAHMKNRLADPGRAAQIDARAQQLLAEEIAEHRQQDLR